MTKIINDEKKQNEIKRDLATYFTYDKEDNKYYYDRDDGTKDVCEKALVD